MRKRRWKQAASLMVMLGMSASLSMQAFAGWEPNPQGVPGTAAGEADALAQADDGVYTEAQFYADLNEALGYIWEISDGRNALTRQDAARVVYDALNYSDVPESDPEDDLLDIRELREAAYLETPFADVAADQEYFKEIAALWYYDALDVTDGEFRPEDFITREEAQVIFTNALTSTITIQDGADEIIRDKMIVPVKLGVQTETPNPAGFGSIQTLEEGTAVLTEDDMLAPMNIGALIGGSVTNIEDGKMTIILGGTPDGDQLIINEAAFDTDEEGRISLKAVAAEFGGTFFIEEDTAVLTFPRHVLKSNRDLTEEEKTFSYTKFYLEYWNTPLPERSDEVAWAKEQSKYDADNPSKEAGGTLYPTTYHKMVEEGYDPYEEEGWSVSADGKWASICVVSPVKGELEDAEAFSWWFAWHGLRDVRYMTWYPPAHWGLGIQNGNDAGRDGNNPNKQFRSFNEDLTIHQRSYGLGHSVAEDTTRTSYNGSTDWIDFYLTKAKPDYDVNTGLNFKDLTNMTDTSPMGSADGITYTTHFSVSEDNTGTYLTNLLDDPQQIGTVGFSGQYMCHFLRWNKETKKAEIITHFSSYNPQGWQNGGASMPGLAMHATREFARLADILAELYALEKDTPLEADYDERSYVFVEIPDETTADFYAAVNELAGEEVLTGGDETSLTRAEAAKALVTAIRAGMNADGTQMYAAFPQLAADEVITDAWNGTPSYLKFTDVTEDTDGYQEILTLHYYKALDAISGTFRPEDPLSVTEAEKILSNLQVLTATLAVGDVSVIADRVESTVDTAAIVAKDSWKLENAGSSGGVSSVAEAAEDAEPAEGDSGNGAADGESSAEAADTAEPVEGDSENGESAGESAGDSASETADDAVNTYTVDDVYADPQVAEALGAEVAVNTNAVEITLAGSSKTLDLVNGQISLRALAEAFAGTADMSVSFRANTQEDGTVNIYEAVITVNRAAIRQ